MKDLMINRPKYLIVLITALNCFFAVFVMGAFMSTAALSQTDATLDQLFTIKDVKVDETARSANQARQTALLQAEQNAYDKLIRKITQAEHRERLPQLSTAERQALISGIEFVDEMSSNRRYVATLNVRFAPSIVSEFLAKYSVPHVLGTGSDILVLHAHKRGMSTILWEQDNIIQAAREEVDWVNRIRGYRFPRGEIKERILISANEVASFETEHALEASKFSNLNSVLMISSHVRIGVNGNQEIEYKFLATDSGVIGQGIVPFLDSVSDNDLSAESLALVSVYNDVLESVDGAWRDRLLVDTGTTGTIDILVASTTLGEIADYERILSEISLVQDYQILEIGLPISRFNVSYTGRQDQLALALRFAGLELRPYGDQMILERQ